MNSKTSKMNIIILSGGSGKRLWPLSNSIRSKQFLKILSDEEGKPISMIQRIYRQLNQIDAHIEVTVAATKAQEGILRNQLGESTGISTEPSRRDTMAAIMLAAAYLHDVRNVPDDEVIIVMPADVYTEESYFYSLIRLHEIAESKKTPLCLMGIEPTYPSEKYGYIIPETKELVSRVKTFREKPDAETAGEYIRLGALWNGGIFAFQLGYLWKKAHELIEFTDYYDLFSRYDTVNKISFDYAVAEKEPEIQVMRFHGEWKDLGTWNTLTEAMEEPVIGNAVLNETCENTHVINDLDMPILCMGLKDAVVAASPEGILVSDKKQSSYIKPYVDSFDSKVMFAEKSWGSYLVLDVEETSMTIRITLNKGHRMNYHSHEHRNEVWTIISGNGRTIVDGMEQQVKPGDVITIQAGCRHTILADTDLKVIEVQLGRNIDVHDKIKYDLED